MTPEQISDRQYIWAYMLKAGQLTTGEYSYYGSSWEGESMYDKKKIKSELDAIIAEIQTFDVDWEKTTIPEYRELSDFEDSFSPSTPVETLKGTIVLNNGKSYIIGVKNAESEYIDLVEKMISPPRPDLKTEVFGKRAVSR